MNYQLFKLPLLQKAYSGGGITDYAAVVVFLILLAAIFWLYDNRVIARVWIKKNSRNLLMQMHFIAKPRD